MRWGGEEWRVLFIGGVGCSEKNNFLNLTHRSLLMGEQVIKTDNNFKSNYYKYMTAQQTQSFAISLCIRQHSRFRHFMWGGLDNLDL